MTTEGSGMDAVRLDENEGVLVVTLDRPKANAIDVATSRALHDAFERLRGDDSLRAAVLTGAGERFFSAGWDLGAAAGGVVRGGCPRGAGRTLCARGGTAGGRRCRRRAQRLCARQLSG